MHTTTSPVLDRLAVRYALRIRAHQADQGTAAAYTLGEAAQAAGHPIETAQAAFTTAIRSADSVRDTDREGALLRAWVDGYNAHAHRDRLTRAATLLDAGVTL